MTADQSGSGTSSRTYYLANLAIGAGGTRMAMFPVPNSIDSLGDWPLLVQGLDGRMILMRLEPMSPGGATPSNTPAEAAAGLTAGIEE
jgi:hypothetical protein